MRKIFSLIAAVLFAGSMMADNFVPVTDASTLADGDQIIITDVDATAAISTLQKSNNRGVTTVALTDGVIVVLPGANVQIITLVAAEANFMLQVGEDAYLYAASNSNNYLKTANAETVGDNGKFAISIASGVASVTAQGSNSRNDLRYNASSSCFSCYGSSSSIEAGLKIFKKESGEVPPVEPTMDYYVAGSMTNWGPMAAYKLAANPANEGEYMGEFTFAANDEFKVGYSDGTTIESTNYFPTGMNNNYVITEAGDYTVYFRPDGQGGEDWHYGCINAIKKEAPAAITCLEVYQKAKNDAVLLNPVTVTYSNGANVWVMDGSASMLIYLPSGFTNNFQAGDVLSGVAGTVDIYQNIVYEVKPDATQAAAIVATPGEAPAPSQAAVIEASDVNKYVILPGFSIEGEFTTASKTSLSAVLGENTVTIYNNFKFAYTFEAGKTYNITGVVSAYKGNPQVYFISAVEATETAIDNTNIDAKVVKFFENGQLFINKNGVIYNAQGTIVR